MDLLRSKIEEQPYIYLSRQIYTLFMQDNKSPKYKSTYCHLSKQRYAFMFYRWEIGDPGHMTQKWWCWHSIWAFWSYYMLSTFHQHDLLWALWGLTSWLGKASPASLVPSSCIHSVFRRAYKTGVLTQAAAFTERDVGSLVLVFTLKPPVLLKWALIGHQHWRSMQCTMSSRE